MRYRCPECGTSSGLYVEVTRIGWQRVDERLEAYGSIEDDAHEAWENCRYGCGECEWEGAESQLTKVGTDGEPLKVQVPGQAQLWVVGTFRASIDDLFVAKE